MDKVRKIEDLYREHDVRDWQEMIRRRDRRARLALKTNGA